MQPCNVCTHAHVAQNGSAELSSLVQIVDCAVNSAVAQNKSQHVQSCCNCGEHVLELLTNASAGRTKKTR